jgi:leucyl/phenylalanyl-tRNA---protein transferase
MMRETCNGFALRTTFHVLGITHHASRITYQPIMTAARLSQKLRFPDPRRADAEGLVAVGGDLSVARLLLAYRSGIFPWTANPISWWSPDPRGVLELDRFHVSRSLAKTLRSDDFAVTFDRAFRAVMEGCAAPAPGRRSTWISAEFLEAYTELHQQGHAHSVECWQGEQLVGGVYGVVVGGLFAGESMFHRVSDASKVALFHLAKHLREREFELFDLQMLTPITTQLGGSTLMRDEYLNRLARAVAKRCSWSA